MQNQPFDTTFAQSYNWGKQNDMKRALDILNCPGNQCQCQNDGKDDIRTLLASNPNTPSQVLDHMALCTQSSRVLERVAGNPNVSSDTLRRLAQHSNNDVRSAVAENSTADPEIIKKLCKDDHIDVRFALAENHNIPVEALEELCQDENPYVAYRAQVTRMRLQNQNKRAEQLPVQTQTQQQQRRFA